MSIKERMKVRTPEKISTFSYIVIFFALFLLFFLFGFPWDSVERRIVSEIESGSAVPILIGDAKLRGISSVELEKVRLIVGEGEPVLIDSVRVGAGIFSVVFSDAAKIWFSAQLYGGTVKGEVFLDTDEKRLISSDADIASVESSFVSSLLPQNVGVSIKGKVDGKISLSGDGKEPGISKMEYELSSESFSFSLNEVAGINVGRKYENLTAELSGTANRFESRVEKFSLANQDVSLKIEGKTPSPLRFRKNAPIDLSLTLKPPANDTTLALLGAFLDRGEDETLSGKITGTVSSPVLEKAD